MISHREHGLFREHTEFGIIRWAAFLPTEDQVLLAHWIESAPEFPYRYAPEWKCRRTKRGQVSVSGRLDAGTSRRQNATARLQHDALHCC